MLAFAKQQKEKKEEEEQSFTKRYEHKLDRCPDNVPGGYNEAGFSWCIQPTRASNQPIMPGKPE